METIKPVAIRRMADGKAFSSGCYPQRNVRNEETSNPLGIGLIPYIPFSRGEKGTYYPTDAAGGCRAFSSGCYSRGSSRTQ
jgi:hypothetical protein